MPRKQGISGKKNTGSDRERITAGIKRIGLLFISFAVLFLMISIRSFASGNYSPIDVKIPFECKADESGKEMQYEIFLKTVSEKAPAPKKDEKTVSAGKGGFFELHVTEPGTYVYRIGQKKGSSEEIIYEETQYDVYVYVVNSEQGELSHSLSVVNAKNDEKPDEIIFQNKMKPVPTPEPDPDPPEEPKPETPDDAAGKLYNLGGMIASKTGEVNAVFVSLFGLSMFGLFAGALVYIAAKKKQDGKERTE